jgi:hypothetical protein
MAVVAVVAVVQQKREPRSSSHSDWRFGCVERTGVAVGLQAWWALIPEGNQVPSAELRAAMSRASVVLGRDVLAASASAAVVLEQ